MGRILKIGINIHAVILTLTGNTNENYFKQGEHTQGRELYYSKFPGIKPLTVPSKIEAVERR